MALVTLLLVIACASVANLLLARGVARRREIAVRMAIGASRLRVFRQLLTESLVITVCGAAIGLLLASWTGGIVIGLLTTTRERLALDTSPGWRTAAFSLVLALAVSFVGALLPSIRASRGDVTDGLKEAHGDGNGLLRRWSAARALVAVQVALAVVLLSGAAVFGRSLARLLAQEIGIDTAAFWSWPQMRPPRGTRRKPSASSTVAFSSRFAPSPASNRPPSPGCPRSATRPVTGRKALSSTARSRRASRRMSTSTACRQGIRHRRDAAAWRP